MFKSLWIYKFKEKSFSMIVKFICSKRIINIRNSFKRRLIRLAQHDFNNVLFGIMIGGCNLKAASSNILKDKLILSPICLIKNYNILLFLSKLLFESHFHHILSIFIS